MDYNRTLEIILSTVLGGGGIVGVLNWVRARKSKKRGVSAVESVAVSQAAVPVGSPDWEALTRYWQHELKLLRADYARHRASCDRRHRMDEAHIDALEFHIWQGKPPPPPARGSTDDSGH